MPDAMNVQIFGIKKSNETRAAERFFKERRAPIQMVDLLGWSDFLSVYRRVYMEAEPFAQGLISLTAASFGHCLAMAERTAKARWPNDWRSAAPFLDGQAEADQSAMRSPPFTLERERMISALGGTKKAQDELTWYACSSSDAAKSRARKLLTEYFGIQPYALPCIPCE